MNVIEDVKTRTRDMFLDGSIELVAADKLILEGLSGADHLRIKLRKIR